jgi:hypothetical protein
VTSADFGKVRKLANDLSRKLPWTETFEVPVSRVEVGEERVFLGLLRRRSHREVVEIQNRTRERSGYLVLAVATRVLDDNGRFSGPLDGEYANGWALRLSKDGQLEYKEWSAENVPFPYVPDLAEMGDDGWARASHKQLDMAEQEWVHCEWGENRASGTHYMHCRPHPRTGPPGSKLTTVLRQMFPAE